MHNMWISRYVRLVPSSVHNTIYIRQLRFSLDIGKKDLQNELEALINVCDVRSLEVAHLDWTKTEPTPYIPDRYNKELIYFARRRTSPFKKFFERLTDAAPNIYVLVMPFNWEDHCMSYFLRLKKLHKLVLYNYLERVDPCSLNLLLENVPSLEKLHLEIHSATSQGFRLYEVCHQSLKHLDIAQC